MKLLVLLLPVFLFAGANWNYDILVKKGVKMEIICKNGYLVERLIFPKPEGIIEETYCYNKSGWDGSCKHAPVKCTEEKK